MATLKDIARLSGVSTATASYVVNNGPRAVSSATRERVLRAIDAVNYRPSAAARGLKGKRTDTIGLIFPHVVEGPIEHDYFAPIMAGILDSATRNHVSCLLFTGLNWDEAENNLDIYGDGRCDGFILIAPPADSLLVERASERGMKFVLVGTHPNSGSVSTVDADNVEGGRLATRHLLELGHRRVAIVLGNKDHSSARERTEGYLRAHQELGLTVDPNLMLHTAYVREVSVGAIRQLLGRPSDERPTAVFGWDDDIARATLAVAAEFGLRVPEDLSIIGFNDTSSAAVTVPPLTTICQPLREIGARAAKILLDHIRLKDSPFVNETLDVRLVVRSTTGPPPPSA